MIHECVIDKSLNRLSAHFGSTLVVRPPATASELAQLEQAVGNIPRALTILLSTCNGLRIDVDAYESEKHLWHTREMLQAVQQGPRHAVPGALIPVRGEPNGECDCVVAACEGTPAAVIRWDPLAPGAALVASDFSHYVEGWTTFMVDSYDSDGQKKPTAGEARFDARFMEYQDSGLVELRDHHDMKLWLGQLDLAECGGDDSE